MESVAEVDGVARGVTKRERASDDEEAEAKRARNESDAASDDGATSGVAEVVPRDEGWTVVRTHNVRLVHDVSLLSCPSSCPCRTRVISAELKSRDVLECKGFPTVLSRFLVRLLMDNWNVMQTFEILRRMLAEKNPALFADYAGVVCEEAVRRGKVSSAMFAGCAFNSGADVADVVFRKMLAVFVDPANKIAVPFNMFFRDGAFDRVLHRERGLLFAHLTIDLSEAGTADLGPAELDRYVMERASRTVPERIASLRTRMAVWGCILSYVPFAPTVCKWVMDLCALKSERYVALMWDLMLIHEGRPLYMTLVEHILRNPDVFRFKNGTECALRMCDLFPQCMVDIVRHPSLRTQSRRSVGAKLRALAVQHSVREVLEDLDHVGEEFYDTSVEIPSLSFLRERRWLRFVEVADKVSLENFTGNALGVIHDRLGPDNARQFIERLARNVTLPRTMRASWAWRRYLEEYGIAYEESVSVARDAASEVMDADAVEGHNVVMYPACLVRRDVNVASVDEVQLNPGFAYVLDGVRVVVDGAVQSSSDTVCKCNLDAHCQYSLENMVSVDASEEFAKIHPTKNQCMICMQSIPYYELAVICRGRHNSVFHTTCAYGLEACPLRCPTEPTVHEVHSAEFLELWGKMDVARRRIVREIVLADSYLAAMPAYADVVNEDAWAVPEPEVVAEIVRDVAPNLANVMMGVVDGDLEDDAEGTVDSDPEDNYDFFDGVNNDGSFGML